MLNLNKVLIGMFLFVFAVSTTPAFGQEVPHGKWWYSRQSSEKLNLSDAEKSKLDDKFYESRLKLVDLKSAVEKERLQLDKLMESETMNEKAVIEQFKKLESARANLSAERFGFVLEVRKILGFERFLQLNTTFRHLKDMSAKKRKEKRREAMGRHPE
jgi:Spy/CpxP family protein refolding chaperone